MVAERVMAGTWDANATDSQTRSSCHGARKRFCVQEWHTRRVLEEAWRRELRLLHLDATVEAAGDVAVLSLWQPQWDAPATYARARTHIYRAARCRWMPWCWRDWSKTATMVRVPSLTRASAQSRACCTHVGAQPAWARPCGARVPRLCDVRWRQGKRTHFYRRWRGGRWSWMRWQQSKQSLLRQSQTLKQHRERSSRCRGSPRCPWHVRTWTPYGLNG